jgi:5-methylcytosine-specific restriction endonuclease McrA
MPFKKAEVANLLAKCRRRCCVCYRFCGIKIETDHMIPEGEGGSNDIDNAIPLCFECHAEGPLI